MKVRINGTNVVRSAVIALSLALVPTCFAMADETVPAVQEIKSDMSCGVCMMYPARYPKWQSQVIFNDGKMVPFDGCKDMFKYILNMAKFTKDHAKSDVAASWVKDFSTGEWLVAKDAIYVVGGEMMGPMGKELIPFKEKSVATKFQEENKGKIMTYSEINMEVLKPLSMGMKMDMGGKDKVQGHGDGMMMK